MMSQSKDASSNKDDSRNDTSEIWKIIDNGKDFLTAIEEFTKTANNPKDDEDDGEGEEAAKRGRKSKRSQPPKTTKDEDSTSKDLTKQRWFTIEKDGHELINSLERFANKFCPRPSSQDEKATAAATTQATNKKGVGSFSDYFALRKCQSLKSPAIFTNWDDCKFYLDPKEQTDPSSGSETTKLQYQPFGRIEEATDYIQGGGGTVTATAVASAKRPADDLEGDDDDDEEGPSPSLDDGSRRLEKRRKKIGGGDDTKAGTSTPKYRKGKPILCFTYHEGSKNVHGHYDSLSSAARHLRVAFNPNTNVEAIINGIRRVLTGDQKTFMGFFFQYAPSKQEDDGDGENKTVVAVASAAAAAAAAASGGSDESKPGAVAVNVDDGAALLALAGIDDPSSAAAQPSQTSAAASKKKGASTRGKAVVQYDSKTGTEQGRYPMALDAAKAYHAKNPSVPPMRANGGICRVLRKERLSYGESYYRYEEDTSPMPTFPLGRQRERIRGGAVLQYCATTGKQLNKFDNTRQAALAFVEANPGTNASTINEGISKVLRGERVAYSGLFFKFERDPKPFPTFPIVVPSPASVRGSKKKAGSEKVPPNEKEETATTRGGGRPASKGGKRKSPIAAAAESLKMMNDDPAEV